MNARDYALHELDARHLPGWPADLPERRRPGGAGQGTGKGAAGSRRGPDLRPPTDPRDLALAEQIAEGVTTNLLLLRHLVAHHSGRSLKSIDALVQKILAIALYQLRFLTRIPASAAVDEAVEQAKRFGRARASGFVNAVLRKATSQPAPALPPREQAADYARVALSHPPELFERLRRLLGDDEKALRFCEHDQAEPPTIVRVAGAGVTVADLAAQGVTLTPHERTRMYVVEGARRSVLADWASRGIAQVQDPTAAQVVAHARLGPGHVVLDRCCGLGTKTMQMRAIVGEAGRVVAVDPSQYRCEGLRRLLEQRQVNNVSVECTAWLRELADRPDVPREFDCAVVDVPCSNSGVLARRAEARYHQTEKTIRSVIALQDRILDDTAPAIKPGGILVYSTCSVWPEENQERVGAFVGRHAEFEVLEVQSTLPSFSAEATAYHDGGYFAVMQRRKREC